MVRLSKLTDYAVVLLTQMVRREGKIATTASLAELTGLSHPTVSKILKCLTKTGLLVAQRGAAGGYGLARPAAEISVADIIIALDGPIALTDCTQASHQTCQVEKKCPIHGHWNRINLAIHNALQNVTLTEMASDNLLPIKKTPHKKVTLPAGTQHTPSAFAADTHTRRA